MEKKKNTTALFAGISVVLLIAVGVMGYMLLKKPAAPAQANVINGMDVQEAQNLADNMQEKQDKNRLTVSMSSIAMFKNGKEPGEVDIDNLADNPYAFTVTYILDDGGKTVIETGLIPVGKSLPTVSLKEPLPKGTYPASAIYTTYDDNNIEQGKIGVAVTIEVAS